MKIHSMFERQKALGRKMKSERMGVVIPNGVGREGLTEKVTFEQRPEGGREGGALRPTGKGRQLQSPGALWHTWDIGGAARRSEGWSTENERESRGERGGNGAEREMELDLMDPRGLLSFSDFLLSEVGTTEGSVQRRVTISLRF